MICPECAGEFGTGIIECPDCKVGLVDVVHVPDKANQASSNLVERPSVKATEAGFVALRLAGFFVLVSSLLGLVGSLSYWSYGEASNVWTPSGSAQTTNFNWIAASQLLAYLIELSVAGYVFINARRVAEFLFSSADDIAVTSPHRGLQAIAFSVVGLVVAVSALPPLGTNLAQFLWVLRAGGELERESYLDFGTFFDVFHHVLSFAVGTFVFVKSNWISVFWSRHQA